MKTTVDIISSFESRKKKAIVYKTGYRTFRLSYTELYEKILKTSQLLEEYSLKKGDKIILWGFNSPEWTIVFLAATLRGIIVVPIDYMATENFVEKIQNIVRAKVLFHSEYKIPPQLKIKKHILEHLDIAISDLAVPTLHHHTKKTVKITENDILEIVFTSGTTGDPKGVIITHKNLLANIEAIKQMVDVKPSQTFLSLLPLSHLFEQNPGFLAPLSSGCTIVYMRGLRPNLIFKTLAEEKITNIVLVPRLLKLFSDGILREVEAQGKTKLFTKLLALNAPLRIRKILFSKVHQKFGKHFQYFIVGGAPLSQDLENFWGQLGFTTVQGYGLTECSPVLTANTTHKQVNGSVGIPLPGIKLHLDEKGEIYVKGENITKGYFNNPSETKTLFENGWMKTGDIGYRDTNGYLFLKGRKKDVIVTSAGVNVYPEDIEQILLKNNAVKDVCVLGIPTQDGEIVHAEVILKGSTKLQTIIHKANSELNDSQQIISFNLWKKDDFPRTTTMKIKKRLVLEEITKKQKKTEVKASDESFSKLYYILTQISDIPLSNIKPTSRLSTDLQLTSIHRVELISLLEQEFNLDINEEEITAQTTIKDLDELIKKREKFSEKNIFRRWLLWDIMRFSRSIYNRIVTDSMIRIFCRRKVVGKENLKDIRGPVIIIANHIGYFDTPNILMSLPYSIRSNTAAAAWKEYFEIPKQQIFKRLLYNFYYQYASLTTNIYLFPKKNGFKKSLEYTGELLDKNWNILFFPEGEHSKSGELQSFRSGIGWLVKEMRVPIVPIKHTGLENIMAGDEHQIPRFGKVTIKIGKPIEIDSTKSIPEITTTVQNIIQNM